MSRDTYNDAWIAGYERGVKRGREDAMREVESMRRVVEAFVAVRAAEERNGPHTIEQVTRRAWEVLDEYRKEQAG